MSKHHHKPQPQEEVQEEQIPTPQAAPQEPEAKPDYYEAFVRLSADFDNFRKRTEREKAALLSYGKKELAEKLLPSYEILLKQSAQLNKKETLKNAPNELKSVISGMQLIATEMEKAFCSEGIEKMDVLNKPYDPATQEVLGTVPADEKQDGLVLQEVQMGFMLDGKVLRPARVLIGRHTEN